SPQSGITQLPERHALSPTVEVREAASPRSPKTFFLPRVAAHVVAALLPVAGPICLEQLDAAYPLGALPRIEPRHHQAQRVAVVRLQWGAVVLPGEQAILAQKVREGEVRREALLAVDEDVRGLRIDLHLIEYRSRADAFPPVVELAPARHAVHVGLHLHARQRQKRIVVAAPRF